jgi:hypothetical protein
MNKEQRLDEKRVNGICKLYRMPEEGNDSWRRNQTRDNEAVFIGGHPELTQEGNIESHRDKHISRL